MLSGNLIVQGENWGIIGGNIKRESLEGRKIYILKREIKIIEIKGELERDVKIEIETI